MRRIVEQSARCLDGQDQICDEVSTVLFRAGEGKDLMIGSEEEEVDDAVANIKRKKLNNKKQIIGTEDELSKMKLKKNKNKNKNKTLLKSNLDAEDISNKMSKKGHMKLIKEQEKDIQDLIEEKIESEAAVDIQPVVEEMVDQKLDDLNDDLVETKEDLVNDDILDLIEEADEGDIINERTKRIKRDVRDIKSAKKKAKKTKKTKKAKKAKKTNGGQSGERKLLRLKVTTEQEGLDNELEQIVALSIN